MDLTYTIEAISSTKILLNYTISQDSTYFLLALTNPCATEIKYAIIASEGCDGNWIAHVIGTQEMYEDLTSGYIYFDENGTWEVSIYYQASSSNVDPDNATLLENCLFQIVP